MPSTTAFEFGHVVLVPFPFTDQTTIKQRPAVVVSSDAYHRERQDVMLARVTSQQRSLSGTLDVGVQHWQHAGLLKPSMFKLLVATVERGVSLRRLGKLHTEGQLLLRDLLTKILGI